MFRFPDVFNAVMQMSSKELVPGTQALQNVVFRNQLIRWNSLTAARTEGLVLATGSFDHFCKHDLART